MNARTFTVTLISTADEDDSTLACITSEQISQILIREYGHLAVVTKDDKGARTWWKRVRTEEG